MNIWFLYIGMTVLLVLLAAWRWRSVETKAISLIVSVIVALSTLVVDYIDDGMLDPFFLWGIGLVWFFSLVTGMVTGWLVEIMRKQSIKSSDSEGQSTSGDEEGKSD